MKIKTKTAHKSNYGSTRLLSNIKYIVIHYTSNDGDTDENNGIYFANNIVKSSAHYFVDGNSITQSVPDNCVAYHCGAKSYRHNECRNANSLGIEICDEVRDGKVYPTEATIINVLELTKSLMKKYNVPKERVIRHYDVTGKLCPAYWCGTAEKDNKWKTEFWNKLGETGTVNNLNIIDIEPAKGFLKSYAKTYKVTADGLNMRAGAGITRTKIKVLPKGATFRCYGYYTKHSDGTIWLYGVDSKGQTGFCSKKYLK